MFDLNGWSRFLEIRAENDKHRRKSKKKDFTVEFKDCPSWFPKKMSFKKLSHCCRVCSKEIKDKDLGKYSATPSLGDEKYPSIYFCSQECAYQFAKNLQENGFSMGVQQ